MVSVASFFLLLLISKHLGLQKRYSASLLHWQAPKGLRSYGISTSESVCNTSAFMSQAIIAKKCVSAHHWLKRFGPCVQEVTLNGHGASFWLSTPAHLFYHFYLQTWMYHPRAPSWCVLCFVWACKARKIVVWICNTDNCSWRALTRVC